MSIGQNIRSYRVAANMTLEELAQRVGVSRQTLSRYETGVIGNIPSDKIELMAKALNTTPAHLMGWEKEKPIANNDDELNEVVSIFESLSPENRGKLMELANLYLADQRKNEEKK